MIKNIQGATKEKLHLPENYVALCFISNNPPKDMPLKDSIELIRRINAQTNYKTIIVGAGSKVKEYTDKIKEQETNCIDLVNKTSIPELADILLNNKGLISVDTGVMHLGCALKVPTAAVFYEQHTIPVWAPPKELYNSIVISNHQTTENILAKFNKLLEGQNIKH